MASYRSGTEGKDYVTGKNIQTGKPKKMSKLDLPPNSNEPAPVSHTGRQPPSAQAYFDNAYNLDESSQDILSVSNNDR